MRLSYVLLIVLLYSCKKESQTDPSAASSTDNQTTSATPTAEVADQEIELVVSRRIVPAGLFQSESAFTDISRNSKVFDLTWEDWVDSYAGVDPSHLKIKIRFNSRSGSVKESVGKHCLALKKGINHAPTTDNFVVATCNNDVISVSVYPVSGSDQNDSLVMPIVPLAANSDNLFGQKTIRGVSQEFTLNKIVIPFSSISSSKLNSINMGLPVDISVYFQNGSVVSVDSSPSNGLPYCGVAARAVKKVGVDGIEIDGTLTFTTGSSSAGSYLSNGLPAPGFSQRQTLSADSSCYGSSEYTFNRYGNCQNDGGAIKFHGVTCKSYTASPIDVGFLRRAFGSSRVKIVYPTRDRLQYFLDVKYKTNLFSE